MSDSWIFSLVFGLRTVSFRIESISKDSVMPGKNKMSYILTQTCNV